MSGKNLSAGQTQVLNVHEIKQIYHHSAKIDQANESASIRTAKNWLNWNCDFNYPNVCKDDRKEDNESEMKQHNGVENPKDSQ
jgi:hypothetical protein